MTNFKCQMNAKIHPSTGSGQAQDVIQIMVSLSNHEL